MGRPGQVDEIPLQAQVVAEPFERWALEFIGPFNPKSNQNAYILDAIDYMTKWVEECYNPKMHHTGLPGIRPTHTSS
jgi:hypothetical protein